ncbi:MAG: OmpA family protein [Raineya sp.]|jgi:outer membrane protein OmpA-like peptidoglycan-associated protein|nr:OmpA family protein [Raineya sp.]
MKKIFIIAALLPTLMYGQGLKKKVADKGFSSFHYAEAIKHYESILAKNPEDADSEEKLAESYRQINDTKNAEKWYAKVAQRAGSKPIAKLYYAEALANEKRYEEAKTWYSKYAQEMASDSRGNNFVNFYTQEMGNLEKSAGDYTIDKAPFNSSTGSDFSPAFMGDKIVFCSNRHSASNGLRKDEFKWTKTSFLDLYVVDKNGNVEVFNKKLNSRYHEGPVAFFKDYNKVVFTRNNYFEGKYKESSEGVNKLKMFFAEKTEDGSWGNVTSFPYNSDEYSVGHPTLSPDGQILYFASDMPGGLGETDIYMCKLENGVWGKPVNMGKGINTEGKEEFPFMDSKGHLFFSSTGHGGFGGLDIFFAENVNGQFEKPTNVGVPLNSSQDDFGIIVDETGMAGYLSSDRASAAAQDDIYKFSGKPFGNFINLKAITIHAETKVPVAMANVEIKMEEVVNNSVSGENGMVEGKFNKTKTYNFVVKKEGFEEKRLTFTSEQLRTYKEGDLLEIPLIPIPQNMPLVLILDEETREPVASHLLIIDKSKKLVFEKDEISKTTVEQIGNGKFDLNVTAKGYFFKNDTMTITDNKKKTEKIVLLKKLKKNMVLVVNNINFEFNSDKLTQQSKKEVDYIYELMKDNPSLKIGVYAHTDAVGTDAKNLDLSNRRAKSVYSYINSKGVPIERMKWQGFGESKPIATNNTKEGRAKNRRVEFEVLEVEGVEIKDKYDPNKGIKEDKFDEKKAAEEEKKKKEQQGKP